MQNDVNYWTRLTPLSVSELGYYWYRDAVGVEPEIVHSVERKREFEFFKEDAHKEIHLEFVLEGSEDMSVMTVTEVMNRFPNSQVGVERIKPPVD